MESWINQSLIDELAVGSRSFEVDLDGWRNVAGNSIPLIPSIDRVHYTDGYQYASREILRAVAERFYFQEADGLNLFNWFGTTPQSFRALGFDENSREVRCSTEECAFLPELSDPSGMKNKTKIYPVERQGICRNGAYIWREGAINGNEHAQLPATVPYSNSLEIDILTGDAPCSKADLSLVFSNVFPDDEFHVSLNDSDLPEGEYDYSYCDKSFSVTPGEINGGKNCGGFNRTDSREHPVLCQLTIKGIDAQVLLPGKNSLKISEKKRSPVFSYCRAIILEKAELTAIVEV